MFVRWWGHRRLNGELVPPRSFSLSRLSDDHSFESTFSLFQLLLCDGFQITFSFFFLLHLSFSFASLSLGSSYIFSFLWQPHQHFEQQTNPKLNSSKRSHGKNPLGLYDPAAGFFYVIFKLELGFLSFGALAPFIFISFALSSNSTGYVCILSELLNLTTFVSFFSFGCSCLVVGIILCSLELNYYNLILVFVRLA